MDELSGKRTLKPEDVDPGIQALEVGRVGRVDLPIEMLAEAMMGDRATAQVVEEGILLHRDVGE